MASLTQSASAKAGSVSLGANVTAGNLVVAVASAASLAGASIRPSTNRLSIVDAITVVGPVQGVGCSMIMAFWTARDSGPLTVEVFGATSTAVAVLEFAPGTAGMSPGNFGFQGSSSAAGSGTAPDPGAVATILGPSVTVVSAVALTAAAALTPTSGYTAGPAVAGAIATEYAFGLTTGTPDAAVSLSVSQAWAAVQLVFTEDTSQSLAFYSSPPGVTAS